MLLNFKLNPGAVFNINDFTLTITKIPLLTEDFCCWMDMGQQMFFLLSKPFLLV